jgi:hypothetical protein
MLLDSHFHYLPNMATTYYTRLSSTGSRPVQEAREVERGNYELFSANNTSRGITCNAHLRPGSNIKMAIVIARYESPNTCPAMSCRSVNILAADSGGWRC